jgi:hypothetical protein
MLPLGILLCLSLIGVGVYYLRFCSERFMMLRRAKSATPYLYGIGGILSLLLMTLATIGLVLCVVGLHPLR